MRIDGKVPKSAMCHYICLGFGNIPTFKNSYVNPHIGFRSGKGWSPLQSHRSQSQTWSLNYNTVLWPWSWQWCNRCDFTPLFGNLKKRSDFQNWKCSTCNSFPSIMSRSWQVTYLLLSIRTSISWTLCDISSAGAKFLDTCLRSVAVVLFPLKIPTERRFNPWVRQESTATVARIKSEKMVLKIH